MNKPYNDMQVSELLAQLGQGKGMPGSGCAAAFSALMGVSIFQSVCKITLSKVEHEANHSELKNILDLLIEKFNPNLTQLMQQDADAVRLLLNDKTISKELTTTPIEICNNCIDILKVGLTIFDKGHPPMLGDSASALTLIDSAARATLFISQENTVQQKNSHYLKEIADLKKYYDSIKMEIAKTTTVSLEIISSPN